MALGVIGFSQTQCLPSGWSATMKVIKTIHIISFVWSDTNNSYEILQEFDDGIRIVIAFVVEVTESADIHFVGSRPFDAVDSGSIDLNDLWRLFRYASNYVENEVRFEDTL